MAKYLSLYYTTLIKSVSRKPSVAEPYEDVATRWLEPSSRRKIKAGCHVKRSPLKLLCVDNGLFPWAKLSWKTFCDAVTTTKVVLPYIIRRGSQFFNFCPFCQPSLWCVCVACRRPIAFILLHSAQSKRYIFHIIWGQSSFVRRWYVKWRPS